MIRILLSRYLFLAPAIALLAMISLAAPAHAQTASCSALSGNYGPAWNPGSYGIGGANYYRDDDTGYGGGTSGSDVAAQSACQSFSQNNHLSGVCQDQFNYVQSGFYLDYSSPDFYMCQVEICAEVTETSTWSYNFYPNVNGLGYSPPTSYNADSFDGTWHYENHGNSYSNSGVCTYTPPPTPPTAAISASPTSITQGAGTTLYWSSTNASSCTGTNFSTGGAPSGAVAVYPSVSTAYYVTCYGPGGGVSAGTTVGVTPALPDLTATQPAAISVNTNTPVTLSGIVRNIGAGATSGAFQNVFEVCDGGCATLNASAFASPNAPALGSGGSETVSGTYAGFSTPGTYYYQLCANNWTQYVGESNYGNDCSGYGAITVAAPLPDLVAGTPPNLTLTAGQSYSFTSTITNAGGSATSGGFWNVLRICTSNCTPYDDHSQQTWLGTLNPGASTGVTVVGTAPSTPGTYYYEVYPNNNTALQNIVAESNYANDYSGPWASLTVVAPPTPTCTLSANPSSISANQSTTLTWTSTNATSNTPSGFSTGGAANGSTSVTPTTLPMSYGLQCVGPGGTINAPPVTLGNSCAVGTLAMTMTATKDRVPANTSVTFNWTASNVQGSSCTVTDGTTPQTTPTNACSISGSASVTISHQTTYTITCDGQSKTVTVNVIPAFNEF